MAPPNQGLEAQDRAGPQIHLGLEVEEEFVVLHGFPQRCFHLQVVEVLLVHLRAVELVVVPPLALAAIHRGIGSLQEVLHGLPVRGKEGNANATGDAQGEPQVRDVLGQGQQQAVGDRVDVLWMLEALQQHDELIASQPGHRVCIANAGLKPLGHFLQNGIACLVTQGVIDVLESVQVQEEDGAPLTPAFAAEDGPIEAILQQGAVGQLCEGVVEGQELDLILMALALGDVAHVHRDAPIQGEHADLVPALQAL
jgi:hypothetical protein